jgi:DNA-binding GntR family transcriptional regulator
MIGMLGHIIDTATFSKIAREAGTPSERAAQHAGHRSHARLVGYIEAGDTTGAERLWRKHIVETTAFLTEGPTASTVLELFS